MNKDMDEINEYLKNKLTVNFMFEDDEVMRRLEICLETLKRYKLIQNPVLDQIPKDEEPTIPFGIFRIPDRKQLTNSSAATITTNTNNNSNSARSGGEKYGTNIENRTSMIEKIATAKLEKEKALQREQRRKKRREKQMMMSGGSSALGGEKSFNGIINGGGAGDKHIPNISDEDTCNDDDDDSDDDDDEDDSDEDDLNPSRLSDYEYERSDKVSIISDLTNNSSSKAASETRSQNNSLEMARKSATTAKKALK